MIRPALLILLSINVLLGQNAQTLDTIYANEKMNTALLFPSEIRQGIAGAPNFIFTHNREEGQHLGLLKATKGADSNLLVITTDGKVYSYILKYSNDLKQLNRFVQLSESIGDEKEGQKKEIGVLNWTPTLFTLPNSKKPDSLPITKVTHSSAFLEKSCASLVKQPERKRTFKRKNGLLLAIKNMVYYEELVFLQLELKNDSGIDFEIDYLNLSLVTGNDKRKASNQSIPLTPIYRYETPKKVRNSQTSRFVYVFPKFTLGDNEKLELELRELRGNRKLVLQRKL